MLVPWSITGFASLPMIQDRRLATTHEAYRMQIHMYARWGQYTTLSQVQHSQVRKCCYYRRAS